MLAGSSTLLLGSFCTLALFPPPPPPLLLLAPLLLLLSRIVDAASAASTDEYAACSPAVLPPPAAAVKLAIELGGVDDAATASAATPSIPARIAAAADTAPPFIADAA